MPTSTRRRKNARGGSTRRAKAVEEDFRPVSEDGSKPPLLDLELIRKLKIMALANILPLTIGTGLFLAGLWEVSSFR